MILDYKNQTLLRIMEKALFFVGLIILQIAIVALMVIFASQLTLIIQLLLVKSPIFSIVGMLFMLLVIFAIPIISAIWAYRDAKKFISQGIDAWMPIGWALVMLFFWFPGLSIYLFLRKFRYKMELQGRTQNT
jgi:hypothetical protein